MSTRGAAGFPAVRWPCAAPIGTRAPAAWLVLPDGEAYPLGDDTRIGRHPGNDVVLARPGVSRAHVVIRRCGGDFVLTDVGSTHGTLINERSLTSPHRLTDGDRIWVCTTQLYFSSHPPARARGTTRRGYRGGQRGSGAEHYRPVPARTPWWHYFLASE